MKMTKKMVLLFLAIVLLFTTAYGANNAKKETNLADKQDETQVSNMDLPSNVIDDNTRTYYQIFIYSFCDSNGDGIGDLNGVTSKLDYIEELGFNGIWLSPIHPSTTYHKYDVMDYMSIDEQYGTMEDFKKLLAECEKRHIKVIMDLVLNHTSAKHEWFTKASTYLRGLAENENPDVSVCPYVDYYHFMKEGSEEPGYVALTGTPYYYEARFWDQMPDLNLENEIVGNEMKNVMKYYLDMGVGGFRLDAAKEYDSNNTEKNTETLAWINDYCKSVKEDAYLVAEVWDTEDKILENYKSGIDSIFNFPFGQSNGSIVSTIRKNTDGSAGKEFSDKVIEYHKNITEAGGDQTDANFLSNHDVGRIAGFLGQNVEQMKFAAGVNLMLSGNAFVYYGEELGMSGSVKGSPGKDENKRAPMYWSEETIAKGMTVGPPNMDDVTHKINSFEKQEKEGSSIYTYYCNILAIRNAFPEISHGEENVIKEITDGDIIALSKTYKNHTLWVLMNNSQETKTIKISDKGMKLQAFVDVDDNTTFVKEGTLELSKYGIAILNK